MRHLKMFGSMALVHIPKQKRKKFDMKSREAILVGYAEDVKGYRLYNPANQDVFISRDVVIVQEGKPQKLVKQVDEPVLFMELYTIEQPSVGCTEAVDDVPAVADDNVDSTSESDESEFESMDEDTEPALPSQFNRPAEEQQGPRRSERERRTPGKYHDFVSYSTFTGPPWDA